ncbi:DeoR family transcriptional regulator [Vibrio sp. ES.051]|uniref:DeoR family transcriptional regulator n=1 Tax=Vibrio sp. ES.051 TaxID=1761909 RepID=UPI000C007C73|nr:DeoR family transcriptional regulator [Vibrio sp. ES.051]PFG46190.1 DeoR family transcriptional regulator [Vibrio sp. ES.051]
MIKKYIKLNRRKKILAMYEKSEDIRTKDIAIYFNVSTHTIRRDLNAISIENNLKIYHGGAKKVKKNKIEDGIKFVDDIISIIFEGCNIYMETSSVSEYLADLLPNINIKVLTNDINIYKVIKHKDRIRMFFFGNHSSRDDLGINFSEFINKDIFESIDIAIIESEYIDSDGFMLSENLSRATLNRLAIDKAEYSYLIKSKKKCNSTNCIYKTCSIKSFDNVFDGE